MKNFKAIIALTALMAISNKSIAQQGKLTAQDRIEIMKALGKQKDIITKVSRGAEATPTMGNEYQREESILKQYMKKDNPEVTKTITSNREQLNKTVKNVDTSLEKIKLAMVQKVGVKGTPLTAEGQLIGELSLLSSADKATAILKSLSMI